MTLTEAILLLLVYLELKPEDETGITAFDAYFIQYTIASFLEVIIDISHRFRLSKIARVRKE